jgi:hypothetical protein
MNLKCKFLHLISLIKTGILILFLSFNFGTSGQTNIGGIINTVSSRINDISSWNTSSDNVDSVWVDDVTGFAIGDTVLFHMTVGAIFDPSNGGIMLTSANSGVFAIFKIDSIDVPGKIIRLNSTLPGNMEELRVDREFGQLIKIPTYGKSATVTSQLTCNSFDTISGTGGILVLMVKDKLILNADINVSGKGFPGATPDAGTYTGDCSSTDPVAYGKSYFPYTGAAFSTLKGYGNAYSTNDSTRGRGAMTNGGGGGNGKYSGGGGGANWGNGGAGGAEIAACGGANIGGDGGKNNTPSRKYYNNTSLDGTHRISLGGGGGTSSQSPPSRIATKGGNGGGIVIIICDKLEGSKSIFALGDSITDKSTAGSGGGGGGGAVVIHANSIIGPDIISVKGGNGGSVSTSSPDLGGPGGGGGAGIIWHNGSGTIKGVKTELTRGEAGSNGTGGAISGSVGKDLGDLKMPIRGFIFNKIPDPDTICKGDTPKTINAVIPAGGSGNFTYTWLSSLNNIIWTVAPGVNNTPNYLPPSDTDTSTYYRRFVKDNILPIDDSSDIVKMVVLPVITNNNISVVYDTVCFNLSAGTLNATAISGGNGIYKYYWEKSPDNTFTAIDTVGNSQTYNTPGLTTDSWYRRKVTSSACKNTSNSLKIAVLPDILNNELSPDQEICIELAPETLTGGATALSGGDGVYRIQWQKEFINIPGANSETYSPPILSIAGSHKYRRLVYSGENNTCLSTSDTLTVSVMPVIANNLFNPVSQDTLCSGLNGEILTATSTSGGNGTYSYSWQKNNVNAAGGNVQTDFNPGILTSTSDFRRIVSSGTLGSKQCRDTSNVRGISVLPVITNNIISADISVWCEDDDPNNITGTTKGSTTPLSGGNGWYSYSWQSRLPEGSWANEVENTPDYITPVITSSVFYRRIVNSSLNGTCANTSDSVYFEMHPKIQNNRINDDESVFVCTDLDSTIQASFKYGPDILSGGNGTYTYNWTRDSDIGGTYAELLPGVKTDSVYTTDPVVVSKYYKRFVKSGECESTSLPVKVEPLTLPELTSLTSPAEVCFSQINFPLKISIISELPEYTLIFENGLGLNETRTLNPVLDSINPTILNPLIPPGSADYVYKVLSIKDVKGCFAKDSNLQSFSTPLKVFATPVPVLLQFTDSVCSNTTEISFAPPDPLIKSYWSLTNVNGITTDDSLSNTIILNTVYNSSINHASASLIYKQKAANCYSEPWESDVNLFNNPDPINNIFKVVGDSTSSVGDTVIIFISDNQKFRADEVVSGYPGWSITSGAGELSDMASIETIISKLEQDNPAFLKYSISNGTCTPSVRNLKIIRKDLLVYDGFSPNDDGINDELWAVGLADEEVEFKFQVFSSSGNFVREITRKDTKNPDLLRNELILWDGTTKMGGDGNFVPEGTYYYVLMVKYHGEDFNKKGYIIVKR